MVSEKARVHNNSDIKRQIRDRRWELASLSLSSIDKTKYNTIYIAKRLQTMQCMFTCIFGNSFSPTTPWD
jgi:hypothetical protein